MCVHSHYNATRACITVEWGNVCPYTRVRDCTCLHHSDVYRLSVSQKHFNWLLPKAVLMPGSRKPLKFWSVTIYGNRGPLPDAKRMKEVFAEFAAQWMFQTERGGQAKKLHYQCRMILEPAQMTETLLHVFECRGMHRDDVTFKPESNKSICQGGLSFYVMKDDTRVEGPWHDPTYRPKKVVVYEGKDLACMKTPREFQSYVMRQCRAQPNDRDMYWWWNQSGCGGKSKLMKFMRMSLGDEKWDMARVPMGSATQIKTAVIEKGPHRIYMVDLPRVRGSDERQQELFSALEEIKNGWVESPMYGKAAELLMEPPHIHIFSNELPNLLFASMDRWRIFTIYDHHFDDGAADAAAGEDGPPEQHFRELGLSEVVELQRLAKEKEHAGTKRCACEIE